MRHIFIEAFTSFYSTYLSYLHFVSYTELTLDNLLFRLHQRQTIGLKCGQKVFILSILPATISTGWFSLNLTVSCSTNNRNKSLTFFNNLRFAKRIQTNAVVSQGLLKRNLSSFMGTEEFNISIVWISLWTSFTTAKAS